jgi:ATP-dependent helicase YprA (DUF1998 family)
MGFGLFFKALAQDQKAALEGLLSCCPGLESIFVGELIVLCLRTLYVDQVSTYDGDTSQEARPSESPHNK